MQPVARPLEGTTAPSFAGPRWLRLPSDRRALRVRAARDGLLIAGWMASAFILLVIPAVGRSLGYDAYSYWFTDLGERYAIATQGIYELGAFRYAPPIGMLFSAFSLIPWWLFLWLWAALSLASALWLGGRRAAYVLAFPPVALEIYHGNIHLLLAVAIVLGFRYPAAWSFVLLTKVTPGIGLLWFAVRREWRSLAVALGATAVIAALSYLVSPGLWSDWFATLAFGATSPAELSIPPPLIVRLPIAAVLVAWGARTDRPWTVGIGAMLALPNLWPHGLTVGLAALPFIGRDGRSETLARDDPAAVAPSLGSYLRTVAATLVIALVIAAFLAGPLEQILSSASAAIPGTQSSAAPGP